MGARRGGGKCRPSPPSPPQKKFFGYIGGLFATFFHMGALATFFSFWGLFTICMCMGAFLLLFTLWWIAFLCLPPPPPPLTKIFAGAHDCKESSRACSTEIFLCDHNLVSSGHVLLRFCLKNDKNNDTL